MRICVITYYCQVVVGPGAQLCTLLEGWVLGVGMSTLDAQTVCTPRIGASKYRWSGAWRCLFRSHDLLDWSTLSLSGNKTHTHYWNNMARRSVVAFLLQSHCLNAPRPDREHHRLTNDSSDQRQKKKRKKAQNKDEISFLFLRIKIKTLFFFSSLKISGTDI